MTPTPSDAGTSIPKVYGVTAHEAYLGLQSFSNVLNGAATHHYDAERGQYLRLNSDGSRQWLNIVESKSSVPSFRRKK